MEYRKLGRSGLTVPVLSFGTATFGGSTEFFKAWGSTGVEQAKKIINICLDSGLNLFDTADMYSNGQSEEILGAAIKGKRNELLLSTKCTFPMTGEKDRNRFGSSRFHIIEACEASLRRLGVDHIDLYHMHGMDLTTPVEETLRALDDLVRAGKIRYIACSNFSGWHLMKSLSVSDRYGWSRYAAHQVYYSLAGRELEWELMPLGLDQGVGTIVWSPLAGGVMTGKVRRDKPIPKDSRVGTIDFVPFDREKVYDITDALDQVAAEAGKTVVQVALNWLLCRPTVSSLVIGARNEEQLKQNLGAVGWTLTQKQIEVLDRASATPKTYPYWHQSGFDHLMPPILPLPTKG